ncbi:hypothetical protein [Cytobacillus praedii]|uniref:Uncharacterized protein n=1 Tax=Cytobacillus praedii TaxID=1742358 RepID=A0A4R1ASV8_9BACI|nr:hypothetical protein [Cytobacillus praedii]TCJ00962.1 hypothetical protein E0Y62_26395 [Cytobacillus praedii]
MYLVIEQYNENMEPTFTKFRGKKKALLCLKEQGYTEFDEPFEQNDGIKYSRSEIDYNTAFLVEI